MKFRVLLAGCMMAAVTPALGATPCDGIWQKSLADGRALLAKTRISGLPARPDVYDVMQSGGWSIVWAQFPQAEPGGYFISNTGRFVEVWGGVAAGESAADLTAWAMKRDKAMPRPLAACFGWYGAGGREKSPPARKNPFSG